MIYTIYTDGQIWSLVGACFFNVRVMHKMQIDADAMAHYVWNRDRALN